MVTLILAAGYASRLYPYTLDTPKPMLTVAGKPIIEYITEQAATIPDMRKILVVTNNKFCSQFEEWSETKKELPLKIINDGTNSIDERLGAVGDISYAIESEKIDEDLIVIAGDNLFTFKLFDMYCYFTRVDSDCICAKEFKDIEALRSLGVCELDKSRKVTSFVEKPQNPSSNYAVYATYMFKRDSLGYIKEFLDTANTKDAPGHFIEWLYKKTDIYAYLMNGNCYDIGTVEAYERIRGNHAAL